MPAYVDESPLKGNRKFYGRLGNKHRGLAIACRGNSDLSLLPLLRTEWRQSEETFSTAVLDQRFAKLPENIDDFLALRV